MSNLPHTVLMPINTPSGQMWIINVEGMATCDEKGRPIVYKDKASALAAIPAIQDRFRVLNVRIDDDLLYNFLHAINDYALDIDEYDYGLPVYGDRNAGIFKFAREWLGKHAEQSGKEHPVRNGVETCGG